MTGYTSFEQQEAFVTKDAENKVSYAMAPVWILTTRFQDEPYTFLMNGQSGKFVGKLPIDEGKCKNTRPAPLWSCCRSSISWPNSSWVP